MDQLKYDLVHYLLEVTGEKAQVTPLGLIDLPYFFSRQYGLYRLVIGHTSFTAVFLKQADEFKPAQFIKQIRQVTSVDVDKLCVVAQSLPTYVRKRLIEKGIAFVVPKVQMYLPALGMDLRPRPAIKKTLSIERFSPATQVVLIHWLLGRVHRPITPLALSETLCYSAMTMSRALDELEAAKIAQVERVGRERLIKFPEDRKTTWLEVLPFLRNPVNQTVRVFESKLLLQNRQDMLPAGVTGLAKKSMLNGPAYSEYAVSRDTWKFMEKEGIKNIPMEEPGTCLLQVWCYDPKILAVNDSVDPFSLYLSFEKEADERIEMALEEMMEQVL